MTAAVYSGGYRIHSGWVISEVARVLSEENLENFRGRLQYYGEG